MENCIVFLLKMTKKIKKSGAYIGYPSLGGGYIQNFRLGEKIYWKPEKVISSLSLEEKKKIGRRS